VASLTRRRWLVWAVRSSVSWCRRVTRASSCFLDLARRRLRNDPLGLGVPGDQTGVDTVRFLEKAHGLGEAAYGARVDDRRRHAVRPEQSKGHLLVSPGRLHGDQADAMAFAERSQRRNTLRRAGEAGRDAVAADPRIQGLGRDVYSTNNLCHDNLPCPCDWRSSDCTVVRDNGGGPNAHPRLWPRGARASLAARGGRRPLATSQRRCYLSTPPTSRYKGGCTTLG